MTTAHTALLGNQPRCFPSKGYLILGFKNHPKLVADRGRTELHVELIIHGVADCRLLFALGAAAHVTLLGCALFGRLGLALLDLPESRERCVPSGGGIVDEPPLLAWEVCVDGFKAVQQRGNAAARPEG